MKNYREICHDIKDQINPSDEFMDNLKDNLHRRMQEEKLKRKKMLCKVAMIFLTVTLISSGVLAMDIGNLIAKLFSNTDESIRIALENGYVQNVDTEYVKQDGIAIKVNSLMIDDNKINIVFDVKGDIDGDIIINDLSLMLENDEYTKGNIKVSGFSYDREMKRIDKNTCLLFIKIINIEQNLNCFDNLMINLKDLYSYKNDEKNIINGNWNFNINLNKNNFENFKVCKYIIEENEYIKDYEIVENNVGLNVKLSFKDNFDKYDILGSNSIYIITENNNEVLCKDYYRVKNNEVNFNIPLENKIDKFKIILKVNKKELIFNVNKIES